MDLNQFFANNQFLSAGFLLMVLGFVGAYLRHVPGRIWDFIERFFIVKIDIQDEDESYQWMQVWLAERLHKTLSISVVTKRASDEGFDDDGPVNNKPKIYFVPAVGTYFFWYKRRFVTLSRNRLENSTSTSLLDASDVLANVVSFFIRPDRSLSALAGCCLV